jgi:hypothetical protein
MFSQATTPLKVIALKNKNPALFNELMLMEAHLKERQDTDLWKYHQNHVVTPLFEQIKKTNFDPDIDETMLHKICGVLDVNTFEIRGDAAEDGVRYTLKGDI